MKQPQTEEQFPLLMYLAGDENQQTETTNSRFTGKGRSDRISLGAASIITEWPKTESPPQSDPPAQGWNLLKRRTVITIEDAESDDGNFLAAAARKKRRRAKFRNNVAGSCVPFFLLCIALFMATLVLFSSMMVTPMNHSRLPRCTSEFLQANRTVHIVHNSHKWTRVQIKMLELIVRSYPDFKINLIIIKNHFLLLNKVPKIDKESLSSNETADFPQPHNLTSVEEVLKSHPNIDFNYYTYHNIFDKTPLYLRWVLMNEEQKLLAVRILQVWQHGGISFDLHGHKKTFFYKTDEIQAARGIIMFLKDGVARYDNLPADMVSVDSMGLHMVAKTPCHAFFGKLLMVLKGTERSLSTQQLMNKVMNVYCKLGAVEETYCVPILA